MTNQSFKHIEVRNVKAQVLKKYPNTKNGEVLAQIHARKRMRRGEPSFVYRVTATLIYEKH